MSEGMIKIERFAFNCTEVFPKLFLSRRNSLCGGARIILTTIKIMLYPIQPLKLTGEIHQSLDLSGLAILDKLMILGSDESVFKLTVLRQNTQSTAPYSYEVLREIAIPIANGEDGEELDLEALEITSAGILYVAGSHSLKRKQVKANKTQAENRQRILEIEEEIKRFFLFRLKIDAQSGELIGDIERVSLKSILKNDPLLAPFTNVPSKENGVDIEAIALQGDNVYLGFRSPVLRLNYVPVIVTTFDDPSNYNILYLDLKGNGIRDMTTVEDGFLLITGPSNDGLNPYYLYFWNGEDGMVGSDKTTESVLIPLGEIPTPMGAKAEGIAVIEETQAGYTFVIIYDNVPQGGATLFYASKTL
jgi:hypothetical protein